MPTPLLVNNSVYQYPVDNDSPGWGEEATGWAVAVTDVLGTLVGTGDILETVANITNNQTSPADVVGLSFDPTTIRGSITQYSVYRVTSSSELVEVGQMYVSYKSVAATWDLVIVGGQGANIVFSITPGGQVQYTTDNMGGTGYSGQMKFVAKALSQTNL
jgi:hypothetical protein